ncbi:MAG: biotin/lipoyl-binding protein, partial [bacterium]
MAKKKKRWWKIGLILIAVLVIAVLIFVNLNQSKKKGIEVTVAHAVLGELVETVPGTGRIQPEIQVKISANVSARITDIRVKEGDTVKKGDLLVTLDRERYAAVVEQSQSYLKSASAARQKAASELQRAQELKARG